MKAISEQATELPQPPESNGKNYNLQVMPLCSPADSKRMHIWNQQLGYAFTTKAITLVQQSINPWTIFFFKLMPAQVCLLRNGSFKFRLHLVLSQRSLSYLLLKTSRGKAPLSPPANRERPNDKIPLFLLAAPIELDTVWICTNTHHTAANLHSDPNHTAYLPTLQEPKHHCSGFLLLLDFTAFRYHCGAILSWKVFFININDH